MRFTIVTLLVVCAGLVWLAFGTLDPCGIVRTEIRDHAEKTGGIESLLMLASDKVLDALIEADTGRRMIPRQCLAWVLSPPLISQSAPRSQGLQSSPATPSPPASPISLSAPTTFQQAQERTRTALATCRDKHSRGEIDSDVRTVECSALEIVRAYRDANYPFMDLVYRWIDERKALADQVDHGALREEQATRFDDQYLEKLRQVEAQRLGSTR